MKYSIDDPYVESAAARHDLYYDRRLHGKLVCAANRHGVWAEVEDDQRVVLTEFGTRVYIGTFPDVLAAIDFIDSLPTKERT